MDLFRSPGISTPPLAPVTRFGARSSRRYGYLRSVEDRAPPPPGVDDLPPPRVDQDFEEYVFE